MALCCALITCKQSPRFGQACGCEAKLTTSDHLPVCQRHSSFSKQDNLRILELWLEEKKKPKNFVNEVHHEEGKIPLRNAKGQVVDYAYVSIEDYENVMQYKWFKKGKYASKSGNNTKLMHHYILGKPADNYCVDHIDGNGLNNTRQNLRFATFQQNAQNRSKKPGTTSKYLGVHWNGDINKWVSQATGINLGCFENEKDAAKEYDTYVLLKYGKDAKTNNLVSYESVKNIDINLIINKFKRELPKNINMNKSRFEVFITYNNKRFRALKDTLPEAIAKLKEFKKVIDEIKHDELQKHFKKPIIRNDKNQAVLLIKNKHGKIVDEVPVPEDKWHELTQYNWHHTKGYYQATVNGTKVLLHRYLMNAKKGDIIDHINNGNETAKNNTYENLRINDSSGNSHNKQKKSNTSSKYLGVSYRKYKNKWESRIIKDGKYFHLGTYSTEEESAIAYNNKAIELYGERTNLNTI